MRTRVKTKWEAIRARIQRLGARKPALLHCAAIDKPPRALPSDKSSSRARNCNFGHHCVPMTAFPFPPDTAPNRGEAVTI
jgi:hypothetical protein